MRALILCMLCVLATVVSAQPKLLVVFVHQAVDQDAIVGRVPSQSAWVVWEKDAAEPYRLATGRTLQRLPQNRPALQIASPANATTARHRLLVRSGAPREVLSLTLASRLQRIGKRGVYLHTPQSPSPTAYALLAVASDAAAPVRVFPSLEAMRLAFFSLEADWALLELKRWDYRALELLLAEGVEVWVLAIPSPDEVRFGKTRLSAVVRFAAREPNGLLTSPSTRWNGVIREVDLVPTLYYALTSQRGDGWLGSPAFETRQSDWHRFWNGWLARVALRETTEAVGLGVRSNALTRSAEWAQANERLTPTFRAALLGVYLGWLGGGVALGRLRWLRGRAKRVFVSGLAVFALAPAVGIAYAYAPFALWTGEWRADAATLAGWLTGCWAALSLLMAGVARWGQVPLLGAAVMVALAVLGADILIAGGYGVNRSLFSAGISSVPAFGVGEAFWAFALAAGLFAPASWLESRGRLRLGARGQAALGMAYGLLLMLCGLPLLGAALDAWLPMTLAFGLGVAIFTGLLPLQIDIRLLVRMVGALLGVGALLTALAVGIDALQPWQRQAGWARDWWGALGWRFAPLAWLSVIGGVALLAYALRRTLRQVWERAFILRTTLLAGLLCAGVALLVGKVVACLVILVVGLMFLLEYRLGGKDWGYPYEGNGVAH
jgi:hypothetical protein